MSQVNYMQVVPPPHKHEAVRTTMTASERLTPEITYWCRWCYKKMKPPQPKVKHNPK